MVFIFFLFYAGATSTSTAKCIFMGKLGCRPLFSRVTPHLVNMYMIVDLFVQNVTVSIQNGTNILIGTSINYDKTGITLAYRRIKIDSKVDTKTVTYFTIQISYRQTWGLNQIHDRAESYVLEYCKFILYCTDVRSTCFRTG